MAFKSAVPHPERIVGGLLIFLSRSSPWVDRPLCLWHMVSVLVSSTNDSLLCMASASFLFDVSLWLWHLTYFSALIVYLAVAATLLLAFFKIGLIGQHWSHCSETRPMQNSILCFLHYYLYYHFYSYSLCLHFFFFCCCIFLFLHYGVF